MRRAALVVSLAACAVLGPRPAAACSFCGDPDFTGSTPGTPSGPALSGGDIEEGFYIVTKGWTENTVTVSGDRTTYSFTTRDVARPTTIAKDVAVVATGERTSADGTSSNDRPVLSDGRPVAGTYVDTYTVDADGNKTFYTRTFLPDDAELKKDAARIVTVAVAPAEIATSGPAPKPAPEAPAPQPSSPDRSTSPDLPLPPVTLPDTFGAIVELPPEREPSPRDGGIDLPVVPPGPVPPSSPLSPARDVRAGVALGPQADVLTRIEVLRGRRIPLWIRATVDGSPARVLSWSLVSGDVVALGPVAGTGDDPFAAQWPRAGRANDVFVVTFNALVEVTGSAPRWVPASIDVVVRSPALIE